jgi:two-component system, NtrC family, nitrogen regulation sensor histidine kinase NtrY
MSLRLRIFLGMLVVVVVSLLSTAIIAYDYSKKQEITYNDQRLLRKESALGRSLDYVISRQGGDLPMDSISTLFTDHICELADVHGLVFSLYRPDGVLITTSATFTEERVQPELVLSDSIVSNLISLGNRVVVNERHGINEVTRVYWLVVNKSNAPLLIANARYKPRPINQDGIRPFLDRLAPVYFFLFLGSMLIAYLLVSSIVRPLALLKLEMTKVEPLSDSASVGYQWKDEIGELVQEYNALLNKLRESLIQRAKDEREGAWREMAQQVAHEIKNPLTPLKLGIQQLERAWNDKAEDFPKRIDKFTSTAIAQIDVLTAIAEDFALLAVVREAEITKVDIVDVVKNAAGLYGDSNVSVHVNTNKLFVEGDSSRLIRVFNNLIANSLDSLYDAGSKSIVEIEISEDDKYAIVRVTDYGLGISKEKLERIFEPRFTTKTHGLGLGLAMVKNIVEHTNGEVSVQSEEGSGAVFIVKLPKVGI